MFGNTGKIIEVNLTTGAVERKTLPEEYYKKYIGGSGLAAKLFWDRANYTTDPLAPEAMLVFMNGPFAGLKMSGASRNSVAGRSPLTGVWGDSSCGGYFAPELRYAGLDGIVITGKAAAPTLIIIQDDKVTLEAAAPYWGKGIESVNTELKAQYGKDARTLLIGQAGEKLVKFANIMNEAHHAFGRAGFGAVMGSKNLKGIVVKASKKEMTLADPAAYEKLRKEVNPALKEALAAVVLNENGTAANLEGGMVNGDVPVKNFSSNYNEEMGSKLTGSELTDNYLTKRGACAFCAIACKRVAEVKDGPWKTSEGPGPEYETIAAFGSLLNSADLAATVKVNRICNDYGVDTITCGMTIAWAMEAFEKGHLTTADTDGTEIHWADMETVISTIVPAIAERKGNLGALLAEGSVAAAKKIGKDSIDYTCHSKGMEAPMHDPRGGGHGLALTYATSPRGACHVATPMLFMEMGACYWPEIGFEYELEPMTDENKPESAVTSWEMGSIENSACWCQFADREMKIDQWVDLFNTVAGYGWDTAEMLRAGRRVFYLKRLINSRFGLTSKDDDLTPRMLEPARDGQPEGIEVNLAGMRERFYELVGFDPDKGIPTRQTLSDYGMADEAAAVW